MSAPLKGLIRKAHLAVNVKKYVAKRPGCYRKATTDC